MGDSSSFLPFLTRPVTDTVDIGRHSRRVRRLKLLLPAAAVLLAGALILWPMLKPRHIAATKREDSAVEMTEARFSGFDGQGRAYTITASHMDKTEGEALHLAQPMADITLSDGGWLALRSEHATLDDVADRLDMDTRVVVFHSGGYTLDTSTLAFDMKSGDIWSDNPTIGQGPRGTVRGTGFHVEGSSGDVVFSGPATLSVLSSPAQDKP